MKDVDLLEKSLLYGLCILREETITKLDESVNEVSEINKWSKIKEELYFNIEYGSDRQLFILAGKIKHKLTETEKKLLDMLSKLVNIDIKYCVKEDMSNMILNLSVIKTEYSQCGNTSLNSNARKGTICTSHVIIKTYKFDKFKRARHNIYHRSRRWCIFKREIF